MISKTQLEKRIGRKTNPVLVETLILAKQHPAWHAVAAKLANSTRAHTTVNLTTLEETTKEGDTVVILGSVVGSGTLSKKIKVCALRFSASAREKLKNAKAELSTIKDEITRNQKAQGVKVL